MKFMEKKKKTILIISILIIASIPIPILLILFPPNETIGERKAFIVCSANDFYRKDDEPGFNNGSDGKFDNEGNWIENFTNGYGGQDNGINAYYKIRQCWTFILFECSDGCVLGS